MTSAPTDTFSFPTYLRPGREEDYERFHHAIPADLDRAMRDAGVLNWRIYRNGLTLTHVVEARDEHAMRARLDVDPINRRWQEEVAPFLASADDPAPEATEPGRLIWDMSWPTR